MGRPSNKELIERARQLEAQLLELQSGADDQADRIRHLRREVAAMALDLPAGEGRMGESALTSEIKLAAAVAIERAQAEFKLNVTEPGLGGRSDRIDVYIRGDEGLQWSWEEPYTKNGQFAWCGAFAAQCWASLLPQIRKKTLPSTYRLWRDWQARRVEPSSLRPGDIVVVFNDSATAADREKKPYGQHITLCRELAGDGKFSTFEGNARACGPSGKYREGVGTRERALSSIAAVYRPQEQDLA